MNKSCCWSEFRQEYHEDCWHFHKGKDEYNMFYTHEKRADEEGYVNTGDIKRLGKLVFLEPVFELKTRCFINNIEVSREQY